MKINFLKLFCWFTFISLAQPPSADYSLFWFDEFNGTNVDETKWAYRIGSKAFTTQQQDNVEVADGYMKIKLLNESTTDINGKNFDWTGGGLISKRRFQYGYFEVRAQMSPFPEWHEAFWAEWSHAFSSTYPQGNVPLNGKSVFELDVMEHKSGLNDNTQSYGVLAKSSGLDQPFHIRENYDTGFSVSNDFHTYAYELTESHFIVYVDGEIQQIYNYFKNVEDITFFDEWYIWLTAIATKQPSNESEVLWDYFRAYELPDNKKADRNIAIQQLIAQRDQAPMQFMNAQNSMGTDLWIEPENFINRNSLHIEFFNEQEFPRSGTNQEIPTGLGQALRGKNSPNTLTDDEKTASDKFLVNTAGTYRLWVRSLDDSNQSQGKRKFKILVNNQTSTTDFGTHGLDGYHWQSGGNFTLTAGLNDIALFDSSSFFARCDKILLTTDLNFTPTGIGGTKNTQTLKDLDIPLDTAYWVEAENMLNKASWREEDFNLGGETFTVLRGLNDDSNNFNEDQRTAKSRITVEACGTYKLWVRSFDSSTSSSGQRFFNIGLNGETSTVNFGTHGEDGFAWQDGGNFDLPNGNIQLTFTDSSQFFARCDKIMITKDLDFIPKGLGENQNTTISASTNDTVITNCAPTDTSIWFEAESLPTLGTWGIRNSFTYNGETNNVIQGRTSEDTALNEEALTATGRIDVQECGAYKLWVRGFDSPNSGDRFFNIKINGEVVQRNFGTHNLDGFAWQEGGVFNIPEGNIQISIIDNSQFFARCDKILLTKDLNFTPFDQYVGGTENVSISNAFNNDTVAVEICDTTLSDSKININSNQRKLAIYPSPVSELLHINCDSCNSDKIEIFNLNGNLVETYIASLKKSNTINIRHLPTGIYVLKFGNYADTFVIKK